MSLETNSSKTKVCPTCGTRLSESATRCLVCGTEFNAKPEPKAAKKVEIFNLLLITRLPQAMALVHRSHILLASLFKASSLQITWLPVARSASGKC
ncbi:MAG: hypothetical protein IPN58_10995 [Anaerolineales bacterium]|nr:hypothetical protein [Anaerolineales bacterium]